VVRYGGEEFAVLLIDVTTETALDTAERIRAAVEATHVMVGGIHYGDVLRASIGVALFPEHGLDEHSLLAAADGALYRAKREGRNRVTTAAVSAHQAPERRDPAPTGPPAHHG
jgi:diguanylate cyclase (GGDEF)-like protein